MHKITQMKSLFKILIYALLSFSLISCSPNVTNSNTVNFAYSKKSNVLHKITCGETKHIKNENYSATNETLSDLFAKGFRLCNVCFKNYDETLIKSENIEKFQQYLKNEFNFLPFNEEDNKILDILTDLYIGICETKESCYDANIEFHRLLASVVYHDDNSSYSNFDWKVTSNLYDNKNEILNAMETYFSYIYENPCIIYGDKYVNHLFDSIMQQHNLASIGTNNNDFAHLSATLCAIENEPNVGKHIGKYASLYNGIDNLGVQAGYIGDICGTNGKEPSLNIPDYKADLDAVNLSDIYRKNKNESLFTILSNYYNEIESQSLNRASTFINNIGKDALELQRDLYNNNLITKYQIESYEYCNRLNYFDNFLQHIYHNDQNFTPCKYKKYNEYENETTFTYDEVINSFKESEVKDVDEQNN